MTTWRLLKPVLILPGNALVVIPALVLWAADGTSFGAAAPSVRDVTFWLGLATAVPALGLMAWTVRLFVTHGQGTPAPWDPPKNLVVRGPYRHVRNPMISSVLFMLLGEALIFQSWPIGGWGLFFFAVNFVYFLLSEEKALERRFGDEYVAYKANVPRWLPRLNPWPRSEQGGRSDG